MSKKNISKDSHHSSTGQATNIHEFIEKKRKQTGIQLVFNHFAKKTSDIIGSPTSFMFALLLIVIWAISGPFFKFSEMWHLLINTSTTVITFLIVFLIQSTQNRDTEIMNLKLDELIKAKKGAKNALLDLEDLSDSELKELETEYKRLKNKRTGR